MTAPATAILIIEDELQSRRFLRATLRAHGYQVLEATTVREGLAHAMGHNPDLILLDLGLPDGDGLDLLRTLRSSMGTPVVVLSARGREPDKVAALDLGADDYLTKPFGVAELLARIRAALRRAALPPGSALERAFTAGNLRVDLVRREVRREGELVHLTPTEYKLLAVLIRAGGRVVTHQALLRDVWGPNAVDHPHYLRVYMAQLRHKLEADPARPRVLVTEPGVGYRVREGET